MSLASRQLAYYIVTINKSYKINMKLEQLITFYQDIKNKWHVDNRLALGASDYRLMIPDAYTINNDNPIYVYVYLPRKSYSNSTERKISKNQAQFKYDLEHNVYTSNNIILHLETLEDLHNILVKCNIIPATDTTYLYKYDEDAYNDEKTYYINGEKYNCYGPKD